MLRLFGRSKSNAIPTTTYIVIDSTKLLDYLNEPGKYPAILLDLQVRSMANPDKVQSTPAVIELKAARQLMRLIEVSLEKYDEWEKSQR